MNQKFGHLKNQHLCLEYVFSSNFGPSQDLRTLDSGSSRRFDTWLIFRAKIWIVQILGHRKVIFICHHVTWHPSNTFWAFSRTSLIHWISLSFLKYKKCSHRKWSLFLIPEFNLLIKPRYRNMKVLRDRESFIFRTTEILGHLICNSTDQLLFKSTIWILRTRICGQMVRM